MAEYIEREAVLRLLEEKYQDMSAMPASYYNGFQYALNMVKRIKPAADVIPKVAYEQVLWERDLALHQLKEHYGVGLGEKKADVAPVVHGRWEFLGPNSLNQEVWCGTCSACHVRSKYIVNKEICPNCGAKMDGEEQDDECRRLEER